jgi:hypothetical protein
MMFSSSSSSSSSLRDLCGNVLLFSQIIECMFRVAVLELSVFCQFSAFFQGEDVTVFRVSDRH